MGMTKNEVVHFTKAPEIQHFAEVKIGANDNVYGVTWANLVKEYLKTAYTGEEPQAEVESFGKTYKVLRRKEVTVFYDQDGNTLFDVTNERLADDYDFLQKNPESEEEEGKDEEVAIPMGTASLADIVTGNVPAPTDEEIAEAIERMDESGLAPTGTAPVVDKKEEACKKLREELEKAKDKSFADPVIEYLLKRCEEDSGLCEDVCQEHKTWEKCYEYIYSQARKQAKGSRCAVRDDVVYEWAEDYYHKDDKAEEEKKAKKKEEAEKKAAQKKKSKPNKSFEDSTAKKHKAEVEEKKEEAEQKEAPKPKVKKNKNDMEGQMDFFSMMGL